MFLYLVDGNFGVTFQTSADKWTVPATNQTQITQHYTTHIAVTWENTDTMNVYMNGQLKASVSSEEEILPNPMNDNVTFLLGKANSSSDGLIFAAEDWFFWERMISAAEVKDLYDSYLPSKYRELAFDLVLNFL